MKGRRALPAAEALTGQKPRQRLSQTENLKHQRFGRFILPNAHLPNSAGGGNRCSLRRRFLRLPWCWQGSSRAAI